MTGRVLPSINIKDDLGVASRFEHYHPTSRSLPVAKAVLAGRATMVIAAYGSGKSLSAGIGALAVTNQKQNRPFLATLAERIKGIDPNLGTILKKRTSSEQQGLNITLSGHIRDVRIAIAQALDITPKRNLEELLSIIAATPCIDKIAIIWDEFGRHLEGLVNEGRTRDLHILQQLAEWAARTASPEISLTLLLHQNLLAYAGTLNQTSRNEWRKVEGRFDTIRFIEDSSEIYGLISQLVNDRSGAEKTQGRDWYKEIADGAIKSGWFDRMNDRNVVASLIMNAHPVSAGALHVLPLIVARVAQNERSLFNFIENADLLKPIGMEEIYLAFSDAMRSDVGVGGLHRRWVEAESARSRTSSDIEREVIAAAFLLQLGNYGERKHLPRGVLEVAVTSKGIKQSEVTEAIETLIRRKLLLYRKLNNDISVWHGVDLDVATRLRDEKLRRAADFDLLVFLSNHRPAGIVRPVRHNAMFGTTRYLLGEYITLSGLANLKDDITGLGAGRILYTLCGTMDDVRKAKSFAEACLLKRTVIVVPDDPIAIEEAAIEVDVLAALRRDGSLAAEDPLVTQELDELLAVARRHLDVILHRLLTDRPITTVWYAGGKLLDINADKPAAVAMSVLLSDWFPKTPRIANDQMMRARISRQMSTNRIRVIVRLMEKSTEPALGYEEGDGSAEASLYRTILARTRLHITKNGQGTFSLPDSISDPALAEIWGLIKNFFTIEGTRSLKELVSALSEPPYGVPAGVMPILVLAGYRAFGRAVSLRSNGAYVNDMLGFDTTRMFDDPDLHHFEVHPMSEGLTQYLEEISWIFSQRRPNTHDELVRVAYDSIRAWRSGIADGAIRSQRLTDDARIFLRRWSEISDPAVFLLNTLPSIYAKGRDGSKRFSSTLISLERLRTLIDGLVQGYLRDAVEVVQESFTVSTVSASTSAIRDWVGCFNVQELMKREDLSTIDKAVLRSVSETLDGRTTVEMLARAMSSLLLKRGIEKWQDNTREHLKKELRECRARIEAVALDCPETSADLAPILEARISQLQEQLKRVLQSRGNQQ